jgi:hypothetical protein
MGVSIALIEEERHVCVVLIGKSSKRRFEKTWHR